MRLSDRVNSQVYPVPTPVVATSIEERELLQTQRSFLAVKALAAQAKATFVGISDIAWSAPLHQDGFTNDAEVAELIDLGAVGEIASWAYNQQGSLIQGGTNSRVASVAIEPAILRLMIDVAGDQKNRRNFGCFARQINYWTDY